MTPWCSLPATTVRITREVIATCFSTPVALSEALREAYMRVVSGMWLKRRGEGMGEGRGRGEGGEREGSERRLLGNDKC